MKIIHEHIMIKVPSVFFDETRFKGIDGKNIIMNVMFHPELHVRNYGEVVSVPDDLYNYPLMSDHVGLPAYYDNPVFDWKSTSDIELEIQEGDKVYFHYNCLLPDNLDDQKFNKLYMFSKKEDGKLFHYFKVKYDLVFAAVRYEPINKLTPSFKWINESRLKPHLQSDVDKLFYYTAEDGYDHIYRKKVIMIGSYVMVEPDLETWESISMPTPETVNGKVLMNPDGSMKLKPKEQWIVTKSMPSERYLRGWVRYTGTPLHGDKPFLQPGNYVFFQNFANTKMMFEGYTFFRMRQRHIFAIDHNKQITYG